MNIVGNGLRAVPAMCGKDSGSLLHLQQALFSFHTDS